MAEYKAIHGFTVQNRTSDTDPVSDGQVYFRSDTGDMKVSLNVYMFNYDRVYQHRLNQH